MLWLRLLMWWFMIAWRRKVGVVISRWPGEVEAVWQAIVSVWFVASDAQSVVLDGREMAMAALCARLNRRGALWLR